MVLTGLQAPRRDIKIKTPEATSTGRATAFNTATLTIVSPTCSIVMDRQILMERTSGTLMRLD